MAARIHELRQERQDLATKANKALIAARDAAKKDSRGFSEEETAAQEDFDKKLEALDSEIKIEEKILDRERYNVAAPVPTAGALPEDKPAPKAGFGNIGAMLQAVRTTAKGAKFADHRLYAGPAGSDESVDDEGAFLVQQDWGGTLLTATYDTGVLVSKVTKQAIGAGSNGLRLNMIDETSRATGSRYGGLQVYWAAEADTATASKPKFRRVELLLKKLIGLMYVTDELLADAVALEGYVNEWFPKEFGFMLDDAIYNGTGAGRPLGILNCPALVTIAKETGQAAASIVANNVEKMFAAMLPSSLASSEWFINVACWPSLFQLYHAIGTAGVPLFLPSGPLDSSLSGAPYGRLLGRPVTPIEQAAAVGTVGDIVLADMSRYLMIDKGPIQTAASIHVKFLTDEMAFRWVLRVDGQPIPNSPITPYKGSQTLSPFVALAVRS